MHRAVTLTAVALSGFTTLATQVIFPRALHPLFGSSGDVGAAVVVTALAGLALGYLIGGTPRANPRRSMANALTAGGLALLFAAFSWDRLDNLAGGGSTLRLILCAAVLSFVPSVALGAVSPLAVRSLKQQSSEHPSERPALVFGIGTLANVVGGLAAGYHLVPFVGITRSLTLLGGLVLVTGVGIALYAAKIGSDSEDIDAQVFAPARRTSSLDSATGSGPSWGLIALAFYSGVASVAIEVGGMRMLASNFGPTTSLWASVLAVSLGGLALGYLLGGRVSIALMPLTLRIVVIANSIWLLISAWGLSHLATSSPTNSLGPLLAVSVAAFLPTFILFGMESQLIVGLVASRSGSSNLATVAGRVFAASTVGGLLGATSGLFFLLPVLGISLFVRLAAVGYLVTLTLFVLKPRRGGIRSVLRDSAVPGLAVLLAIVPMPDWRWSDVDGVLLTQREGRHQTIRVYSDEQTYLRFHLGPTFESEVDYVSGQPLFGYAQTILSQVGEVTGERVLVIGGAGHALARAFELRGAAVTEVEYDPLVVKTSNEFFGTISGEVVVEDGRRYVSNARAESFDVVVIDAFDGPNVVPPHITTAEFYREVSRVLDDEGALYINMIGEVEGPRSGSFDVMSSTVASEFASSGRIGSRGNIVLIASNASVPSSLAPLEVSTAPNTDDLNPMEIMTSRFS